MANQLQPIPNQPVSDTHEWREWFFNLYQTLGGSQGTNAFTNLDFTGSNITSIVNRAHNSLQGLQGGNDAGTEYYHLSSTQQSGLTNYTNPVSSITVTASPFTYQNSTGYDASVLVNGGTVSLVQFSRNNVTYYTTSAATNTILMLSPNDYVKVTYTAAPTMVLVPR
jgi:hypothetical protein